MNFNFISDAFTSANSSSPTLTDLFTRIINITLTIAAALAVVYLIYSGILYITAAGNPDSAKKGQQGIINAVIGIIIIILAFVIANAVAGFIGKGAATNI